MTYDLNIPGQINEFQLRAIEAVATLVPENGVVVEIGSLFGRSSYAWGASVLPSVTVHCIDPWKGNSGATPLQDRWGITYSIEQFREYTKRLQNIVPHQGYSPRDFSTWDQDIDLFYEDSVHRNPTFSKNLHFWLSHLKSTGIACGDDYRPRFPDIVNGVGALAEQLGRELIIVDKFWCLLPSAELVPAVEAIRERLLVIKSEAEEAALTHPFAHTLSITNKSHTISAGTPLSIEIYACNESPFSWNDDCGNPLTSNVLIGFQSTANSTTASSIYPLNTALEPDRPVIDTVLISTTGLSPGTFTATAQLLLTDDQGKVNHILKDNMHWLFEITPEKNLHGIPDTYQAFHEDKPENFNEISSLDVHAAYRMFLGRPPEGGEQRISNHLEAAKSLDGLRQRFIVSPEFQRTIRRFIPDGYTKRHPTDLNTIKFRHQSVKHRDRTMDKIFEIPVVDPNLSRDHLLNIFRYQPFKLPDGTITGSGNGQVYGGLTRAMRPGEVTKKEWDNFFLLNSELTMMYEDIIWAIKNEFGSFKGLSFADFACNSGYFCYRYLQEGAEMATGIDGYDFSEAFSIVNRACSLNAKFIHASYNMMTHEAKGLADTYDIVSCIAFMCYSSDPTYLLTYLAKLANRALVVLSKIPHGNDELFIKYANTESKYFNKQFPICFDAATEISEELFRCGLKSLGFKTVIEILREKHWQPRGTAWRCFIALR
ncbi:class I SAM-dependent methyltransferase [Solidesulfovibrio magneticus]|uniref:Methyltransferase domain-containing protein n=1 Tax=Solidesulfovibrio magneticus (strain ATCC 700980 / DSM 13731 / RS-1) TaxID=573370 RepID=C4XGM0_SOLM1|nr:class I SAM-dependent methyltransferase [Solidesulfovibrio magneticus]BAH73800.1 hypothetical protein DMR_03090 [Solidesulfovibrio magneticus RS-1]